MRKFILLVTIATTFVFPIYALADIIGDVTLSLYYSGPTGTVTIPNLGTHTYYLDYEARLNGGPLLEVFCVENSWGPTQGKMLQYTLITMDTTLSNFGLNATNYLAAGWFAQNYYNKSEDLKAAAQIVIWEIIFDGINSFNLSNGNFSSTSYVGSANDIWNSRPNNGFPAKIDGWALAVNPTITSGSTIPTADYQNYLVPVPEPSSLLLMGAGLLGLGLFARRRKK